MNAENTPPESKPQQPPHGTAPKPSGGAGADAESGSAALDSQTANQQPAAQSLGDDRRSSPRRKKLLRVQLVEVHVDANGVQIDESEPFPGWVIDRSLGGLRLEVERKIEAGSLLKVRSPFESAAGRWVEVRVQSVQDLEDCRYLGCSFVRTPTWEVLMQFG